MLFALLVITGVVEILMTAFWRRSYFRSGFPIFKRVLKTAGETVRLDTQRLQQDVDDYRFAALFVRPIGDGEYAFREKLWQFGKIMYTPLMHGHIVMLDRKKSVEVIGRLNWLAVILPPYMGYVSYWLFGGILISIVSVAAAVGVMRILYLLQSHRFRQMAVAVARQLEV